MLASRVGISQGPTSSGAEQPGALSVSISSTAMPLPVATPMFESGYYGVSPRRAISVASVVAISVAGCAPSGSRRSSGQQ